MTWWTRTRRLALAWLTEPRQFQHKRLPRFCQICQYRGVFIGAGHPPRWDARCPNCGSQERHRLLHLWVTEGGRNKLTGQRILHFAPEKALSRTLTGHPLYETADLLRAGVTHRVDIASVPLPAATYDAIIANHVLEHIPDDRAAMRELHRLLKPGGFALLTAPINPTRQQTYENPAVVTKAERHAHFGEDDHVRYYGLDFADRLAAAGFAIEIYRVSPAEEVRYGLRRDEWLYIARRPDVRR